jgi:hypothetical protein
MKEKLTLIALITCVITGCKVNQHCDAYSQCDELYMSDYNCVIKPVTLTTPYRSQQYTPVYGTYGYPTYYNTYYNTYNTTYSCPESTSSPVISQPRPSLNNVKPNTNTTPNRRPQREASPSRESRD